MLILTLFILGLLFTAIYLAIAILPFKNPWDRHHQSIFHVPDTILLSFDDGPDPIATPAILDLLKKYDRKAFFFLIGHNAKQYPDIVKRIVEEGHTLGNHSTSHPSFLFSKQATIDKEIRACQKIIEDITGITPRYVRPPYGHRDFRFYQVIAKENLTCMLWSRDSFDYLPLTNDFLKKKLFAVEPGDILLNHDRTYAQTMAIQHLENWLVRHG